MKAIVQNLATEYTDEGAGPILLMLHGWGDNLHTFDSLVRELSNYRIVRIDMPGFGGSEKPKEVWGVEGYATFVQAFCKKLQLESQVFVGHSFGGRVIIKGVGEGILKPQKIVLIASAGVAKRKTMKNVAFMYAAKVGKAITHIPPFSRFRHGIRKRIYRAIGSDYFAAGSMGPIFRKVVAEDLLQYALKIHTPALLIWGSADRSTPLAHGEMIHKAIQGSRLEIFPGAGHFVHQEKTSEVATLIKAFV